MPRVRWPEQVLTGNESEERFGYSQAVADGGLILVSGQVGRDMPSGALPEPRELATRLRKVFSNIRAITSELAEDASLVSIGIYLPMAYADAEATFCAVVPELLGDDAPAASIIPIGGLFNPDYLVEVSAVSTQLPVESVPDEGPIGRMLSTSKAVRVGTQIHVSGQLPVDEAGLIQGDTAAAQLEVALRNLDATLGKLGAGIGDVMSSQLFVAGMLTSEEMGALTAVHVTAFGAAKPASTLVFVPELPLGARVQIVAVAVAKG